MRVISGKYKGRVLEGYTLSGTRPTMERVKESVFAILQNCLENAIVLDLFSGSGNLGIESLSQGAKCVYFVDSSKKAVETIQKNLNNLNITEGIVWKKDYLEALDDYHQKEICFDIIFLDPPYATDYISKSLLKIEEYHLLSEEGIIVCETDQEINFSFLSSFSVVKEKKYGSKFVVFLQKI